MNGLFVFVFGLLSLFLVESAAAWAPSSSGTATIKSTTKNSKSHQRQATTPLFAKDSASRRDWLSGIASAVVGTATAAATVSAKPASAAAATATTTLEKPAAASTTLSVISTRSVCDPSVSTWYLPKNGRTVYLLGTAHISSESAALAGQLVRDVRPEGVFVELDAKRVTRAGLEPNSNIVAGTNGQVLAVGPPSSYETSTRVDSTIPSSTAAPATLPSKRSNPFDFKQRALQAGSAAVGGAIKGMYSKLDSAGFQAGAEFAVAVREGQELGSKIILGDRDVEETLKRLTQALAETDLKSLLSLNSELEQKLQSLMPTDNGNNKMPLLGPDKEQLENAEFRQEFSYFVETMKAKENVKLLMGELQRLAPQLYQAMVAERDLYMANGLDTLNDFSQIVAVMGIAHVDGVEQNLRQRGWQPVNPKCKVR